MPLVRRGHDAELGHRHIQPRLVGQERLGLAVDPAALPPALAGVLAVPELPLVGDRSQPIGAFPVQQQRGRAANGLPASAPSRRSKAASLSEWKSKWR